MDPSIDNQIYDSFTLRFKVKNKDFTIDFKFKPDIAVGNPIFIDLKDNFTIDIVNELCIRMIEDFKNTNPEHYIYETPEPYWFFHDMCHSLYTADLLYPEVLTIPRDVEASMWKKGLDLARECKLDEKFLVRIPVLKDLL